VAVTHRRDVPAVYLSWWRWKAGSPAVAVLSALTIFAVHAPRISLFAPCSRRAALGRRLPPPRLQTACLLADAFCNTRLSGPVYVCVADGCILRWLRLPSRTNHALCWTVHVRGWRATVCAANGMSVYGTTSGLAQVLCCRGRFNMLRTRRLASHGRACCIALRDAVV